MNGFSSAPGRVRAAVCLAIFTAVATKAGAQSAPKIFDVNINHSMHVDPALPEIGPIPLNDRWTVWNETQRILPTYLYQLSANKYVATYITEHDAPAINTERPPTNTQSNNAVYYSDGYILKTVNGVALPGYFDQTETDAAFAQATGSQRNTLTDVASWLSTNVGRLDYVIADFEDVSHTVGNQPVRDVNTLAMVSQVRAHANVNIRNAKIGNYGEFPGTLDLSELHPSRIDRTNTWAMAHLGIQSNRDALYRNSGLNVAMPNLYPYSAYKVHAAPDAQAWGWMNYPTAGQTFVAPNYRSALFWAPLERLSVAARALPAGHELIPFVSDYVATANYDLLPNQKPTLEDNEASIEHYRLRGADGYFGFIPVLTPVATYRAAVNAAWHSLDAQFNRPGARRILNLDTNKTAGIQWSGVEKGSRVLVLLSNLNSSDQTIDWSRNLQLPVQSPSVAAGTHVKFQYVSSYLDNDNMEKYTASQPMNNQGSSSWQGPNAGNFSAAPPPGAGNTSTRAVVTGPDYARYEAWYSAPNAGFTPTDKVVYSAWLYLNSSSIGFLPTNTASGTPTQRPGANHHGPYFAINWTKFKLRSNEDAGISYEASNLDAAPNKWYEVQVAVDPTRDIDGTSGGNHGAAAVWVRNVTDGQPDFTRLVFDDPTTAGLTERLWEIPLQLNAAGGRDLPNFNGWIASAFGAGNAIDNLNSGYYVPHMGDNFEHYSSSAADVTGVPGWVSGQSSWRVQASTGVGNGSSLALTPVTGVTNALGRWRTETSGLEVSDKVTYEARLNSGALGGSTASVGFGPVNTAGGASGYGPFASIAAGELRLRPTRVNGPVYKANNVTASPSSWYEVRLEVDPTRDIDGTSGGQYGVAKMFVRDLSLGQTSFTQVMFDDTTTTGALESFAEIPLWLGANANVASFDGWEVTGYDSSTQVDSVSVSLQPN